MNNFVAILMGSDSDLPVMQSTVDTLRKLEIAFEVNVLSAHRTPDLTANYVKDAELRGCKVFIAAAGMAAHLAGAVAANTIKPVIGIPLDAGSLQGMDALLATVQMPGGTPVATVSIGKAGAVNAAFLAAQIFAIHDEKVANKLQSIREQKREQLVQANRKLNEAICAEA